MLIDRRLLRNFDYGLLLVTMAICAYSAVVLSSATSSMELPDPLWYVKRQILWALVGLGLIAVTLLIDYINYFNWYRYLYLLNIALLVAVFFVGREGGGARRWISMGFFDLQPSEFAKLITIITLARLLAQQEDFDSLKDLAPSFAHMSLPMVLILRQPDLGTSLVFIIVLFGMLYVAGAREQHLLIVMLGGAALTPLLWRFLEDYQKLRLIVFINPDIDPLNAGYQLRQSMIAIGSGGTLGKGLLQGTQTHLQFLPAQHTDFIFSVLCEELGLVGALGLLLLYLILIYRIFRVATMAKERFGMLICCGVAFVFTFQVIVNIGMTIGIMPITGLPLPFMSYGGSSMLINLISIGVVLNIGMRRHKIQF